jgi:hypothetical protein
MIINKIVNNNKKSVEELEDYLKNIKIVALH